MLTWFMTLQIPCTTFCHTNAKQIIAEAKAQAEACQIEAQEISAATHLQAQADADAMRTKSKAAEDVQDEFS